MRIALADRQIYVEGRRLHVSPKFFQLYCRLALERAQGRLEFLALREIHRLPAWSRGSLASVGKEVSRHARRMRAAGWDLLESPPRKATHLVRLQPRVVQVEFDRPLAEVRAWLGLDLRAAGGDPHQAERAFELAAALAAARAALERGALHQARAALARAEQAGPDDVRDRVLVALWWSRLLDREGHDAEALARASEAEALCAASGVDHLTCARVQIWIGHLGWRSGRANLLAAARAHYRCAQDLLGAAPHFAELAEIAIGLGHVARLERDWPSATAYLRGALRYATADGWAWGIQAAAYYLGLVCAEHAEHVEDPGSRSRLYREARDWAERCIRLAGEAGVDAATAEAESLLADLRAKLGQPASPGPVGEHNRRRSVVPSVRP
ncbi:MAG: hypothetical protein QN183_07235 [Armatimonadota bacterium]|nr:hypothetical protein [Armatimonadota bacterium]MDR7536140.1 hypothetical protein [Armatimonadota bacterium]